MSTTNTPVKDVLYSSRYYSSPYASTLAYSTYPYTSSLYRSAITPPRTSEWTEYQPVERKYIDYVPETKVEYVPVERTTRDYVEIKHVTSYEPQTRVERRTEYVPVEHVDEYVDYYPKNYSYVSRSPSYDYSPSLTTSSLRTSNYLPYYTSSYYRSPYSYRYYY
ncbi:hypothetical protein TTHERM_00823650 (macronuclear) [Tetrahymena thermophila SB210]|uniref:Uncharacterized protein n=1 Tax=Tetrahymena thermophila (strain SB210) TaxID=312017 RepID=I7MCF6_TETTS|nr:hypothetical protein TTHERM_00823650 [Tetrahymena thermophila SB210]EAR83804.1 hypothetical protein TTHERM_00823650 [Tetrahymena thermophila SB210]|eukprot:XP_001031467.1 hypothetical protein TTHERM_00823650 [Tetrahymena thermophila SB210]